MKNFREWLLEQEKKEKEIDDQNDNEEDDDDDGKGAEDQDNQEDEEQPQKVFPTVKKKSKKLRDPDKVIKQNDKEMEKDQDCDEDESGDGLVSDMPTGTTSADVATVDNKINIVSRSLHKKLKSKDVEDSLIPTD